MIENSKRNLTHIEALRILAIFLVMFNHTGTNGYFLFSVRQQSPFYGLYLFVSIFCKIAVPIFFMISGALILGKEESIGTILKKRLLRFVIVLIGISFFYHIYDCYYYNSEFDLKKCLLTMYTGNAASHLWYLYSYIGIILMLPFLRRMVKTMEEKEYWYLVAGNLIFVGLLPIVQYLFTQGTVTLNSYISVPLFKCIDIFYFLMGYYFERILSDKYYTKKNLIISGILSVSAIAVSGIMTYYRAQVMGECNESVSQVFHSSLIAIPAFTVYFYSKYFFARAHISYRVENIIRLIGSTTFGIYLLEKLLRTLTIQIYYDLEPILTVLPACFIWIGVALLLGCMIVLGLRKIPLIKKFI